MDIFIDLDCLSKLLICNALDKAIEILSPQAQYNIADSFPYTACNLKKKAIKAHKPGAFSDAYDRIASNRLGDKFHILTNDFATMSDKFEALTQIPNIDAGEAGLIIHATQCQDSELLTGDSRFLTALANNKERVFEILGNRKCHIIHFLEIVRLLCHEDENNICLFQTPAAQMCDTSLRSIFGGTPTLSSIDEGVESYIGEMMRLLH